VGHKGFNAKFGSEFKKWRHSLKRVPTETANVLLRVKLFFGKKLCFVLSFMSYKAVF